jgi:hypothetical protein
MRVEWISVVGLAVRPYRATVKYNAIRRNNVDNGWT